jgi:hypothetical protein
MVLLSFFGTEVKYQWLLIKVADFQRLERFQKMAKDA